MAPIHSVPSWYPLRSVTQRLSSTFVADLPYVVPSLVLSLSTCGQFLSEVDAQNQRRNQSEASVVVHKLKTQISTLLQNRSKEARWSAVVLAKTTVEAGGWNILQESEKWVRALIGLIGVSRSILQWHRGHRSYNPYRDQSRPVRRS